jgi:hypothetical protein
MQLKCFASLALLVVLCLGTAPVSAFFHAPSAPNVVGNCEGPTTEVMDHFINAVYGETLEQVGLLLADNFFAEIPSLGDGRPMNKTNFLNFLSSTFLTQGLHFMWPTAKFQGINTGLLIAQVFMFNNQTINAQPAITEIAIGFVVNNSKITQFFELIAGQPSTNATHEAKALAVFDTMSNAVQQKNITAFGDCLSSEALVFVFQCGETQPAVGMNKKQFISVEQNGMNQQTSFYLQKKSAWVNGDWVLVQFSVMSTYVLPEGNSFFQQGLVGVMSYRVNAAYEITRFNEFLRSWMSSQ